MKLTEFKEKVKAGYYDDKEREFINEAFVALDLIEHPKQDAIYQLAREYAKGGGNAVVWEYIQDLVDLIE